MPVKHTCLAALGFSFLAFHAVADEESPISTSVFGTLGVAKSNNNDFYFRSRTTLPEGIDNSWSFHNDSNLGIQLTYEPSEKFSATILALAQLNESDDYGPLIEWAYLTYSPNENLKIRVGRTVFPTFIASDYSSVSFTYLPVRLPQDVYSLIPFQGVDGIDFIYDTNIGETYLQFQGLIAQRDFEIFNDGGIGETDYELENTHSLRATLRHGNWSVSAGYLKGDMKVDVPEVQELAVFLKSVTNIFPVFSSLANGLSSEGEIRFSSFGIQYSSYRVTFSSEYVQRRWDINLNVSDNDAYYLMGGYHIGKWTPYAFYSNSKNKSKIPLSSYPTEGPAAPITFALGEFFSPLLGDGNTKGIGLRYDFLENLAIKAQFERINVGAQLFLKKEGQPVPESVNLASLALSFVY
ncbi:porin [Aliiglaciecola litoralis]|uniref:Porin domain-containing protein n=1 Tax=Aliiglaciecola litoralis TaxID=582857 RepID=A0ABP3X1I2_9ALTE